MAHAASTMRVSPGTIPAALLGRYHTSGPRYTSYPTAPQFRSDLDWEEVLRRWRQSNEGAAPGLSLYVHVPFCRSRCAYCGCFTKVEVSTDVMERYVDAVVDNAAWAAEILAEGRPVGQLALGGGTPTHLEPALMRRLVDGVKARFDLAPDGERGIELDPRWIDEEYLDLLLELGFGRFSFGVQDFDPRVQLHINRVTPPRKVERLLSHLRKRGHRAINLDLIYGLPGQTTDSFERTIRQVISLRPSRIATFGYAHVPWVSPHQKALEDVGIMGPEKRMELFGIAYDLLLDAGWRHVGMDHFALPDDELVKALDSRTLTRSFMGYTTRRGLDLVPLGASAIGAVGSTYVQNTKDLDGYNGSSGTGRWARGYLLDGEDLLRREIIIDLLCNFYLDTARLSERHGIDFAEHFATELAELARLEDEGLVEVGDGALVVTALGRFFIRNVTMVFDAYLRREGEGERRYSKTI